MSESRSFIKESQQFLGSEVHTKALTDSEFLAHSFAYKPPQFCDLTDDEIKSDITFDQNKKIHLTFPNEKKPQSFHYFHSSPVPGLVLRILVPLDEKDNQIKIIFRGTADLASVLRDIEPTPGIGEYSFKTASSFIMKNIAIALKLLKSQKKSIAIFGHSLGGADAQHCLAVLLKQIAKLKNVKIVYSDNIFDEFNAVNHIKLAAFNSAGVSLETAKTADESATYLAKNNVSVEVDYLLARGDGVQQTGLITLFGDISPAYVKTRVVKVGHPNVIENITADTYLGFANLWTVYQAAKNCALAHCSHYFFKNGESLKDQRIYQFFSNETEEQAKTIRKELFTKMSLGILPYFGQCFLYKIVKVIFNHQHVMSLDAQFSMLEEQMDGEYELIDFDDATDASIESPERKVNVEELKVALEPPKMLSIEFHPQPIIDFAPEKSVAQTIPEAIVVEEIRQESKPTLEEKNSVKTPKIQQPILISNSFNNAFHQSLWSELQLHFSSHENLIYDFLKNLFADPNFQYLNHAFDQISEQINYLAIHYNNLTSQPSRLVLNKCYTTLHKTWVETLSQTITHVLLKEVKSPDLKSELSAQQTPVITKLFNQTIATLEDVTQKPALQQNPVLHFFKELLNSLKLFFFNIKRVNPSCFFSSPIRQVKNKLSESKKLLQSKQSDLILEPTQFQNKIAL